MEKLLYFNNSRILSKCWKLCLRGWSSIKNWVVKGASEFSETAAAVSSSASVSSLIRSAAAWLLSRKNLSVSPFSTWAYSWKAGPGQPVDNLLIGNWEPDWWSGHPARPVWNGPGYPRLSPNHCSLLWERRQQLPGKFHTTRSWQFTEDGTYSLSQISLDFACRQCHNSVSGPGLPKADAELVGAADGYHD